MRLYAKTVIIVAAILQNTLISATINADLDFDLVGEGFHRTLRYEVNVDTPTENDCSIALHVSLPPAIYVNVDEIADLKRLGKTLACSVGEIDVELFAERASPQNVTICEELTSSSSVLLSLPVHQRYKFSGDIGGYISVEIPPPKLLLGCVNRLREHRVSKVGLCSPCVDLARKWREIPYRMESSDNKLWQIPVGNLSYLNKVSYVTLLVTSVGAAAVLRVLMGLRTRGD